MADLENEGKSVTADTVNYIHRSKTGAMIRASVVTGGIIAGATDLQIERLGQYGNRIGLAFQICDDILDVTSTSETARQDRRAKTKPRSKRPFRLSTAWRLRDGARK